MRTQGFDNSARTAELSETGAAGESEGRRSRMRRRNPCPGVLTTNALDPTKRHHRDAQKFNSSLREPGSRPDDFPHPSDGSAGQSCCPTRHYGSAQSWYGRLAGDRFEIHGVAGPFWRKKPEQKTHRCIVRSVQYQPESFFLDSP